MSAIEILLSRLTREEGEKTVPYDDATGLPVRAPKGHLTWGRGFNLEQCGSPGLFDVMERYLIEQIERQIQPYTWYTLCNDVRKSVLLDIAYNAGVNGLLHFPHMLAAIARADWLAAARECAVADPRLDASRYDPLRQLLSTGVA